MLNQEQTQILEQAIILLFRLLRSRNHIYRVRAAERVQGNR